jgi:hypothetical protein
MILAPSVTVRSRPRISFQRARVESDCHVVKHVNRVWKNNAALDLAFAIPVPKLGPDERITDCELIT